MEPLLPLAIAAADFVTVAFRIIGRPRTRLRSWQEAALAAHWEDMRADDRFGKAFLEGRAEGLPVRFENYRRGRYEWGTRLLIRGLARLSARRESAATAIEKRFLGETEIELGAPAFDERCFVSGSSAIAHAVLDTPTRRLLASALSGQLALEEGGSLDVRARLSEGTLTLECRAGWSRSSRRVRDLLRGGLALARHLTLPPDLPLRIARNLATESEPAMRLNALATLAREYPDNPATQPALVAALQDASVEVRLRAASALGEKGQETLLALVRDETTEDGCAARAIAALGERLSEAEAVDVLRRALDSGRPETAIACLDSLAAQPATGAEEMLLTALRAEKDEVRVAAARALGRAGSAAAVPELLAAAEAGPGDLRRVTRQAIAEIQSRLPGAGPGQLSLASGTAGALSVVEVAAGGLSVVTDSRDPLAMPPRARQSE